LDLQKVDQPFAVFEENGQVRRSPAPRRVDDMFEQVKTKLPGAPRFLLCVLAERKNSDVYGWFSFLLSIQISLLEHLYNPSLFFNRSMEEEMPC
jgi:hypothetical protein